LGVAKGRGGASGFPEACVREPGSRGPVPAGQPSAGLRATTMPCFLMRS
jgi:hypothetical protein